MELPKDLKDKVWNYCRLNDITDVNGFIIKTIKKGLDVEVYGFLGKTLNEGEKDLKTDNEGEKDLMDPRKTGGIQEKRAEIEVIREIRVEVPVEVIKEVEKIVTKIEYISDKTTENELDGKITKLEENIFHLNNELDKERQIFSTKTEQMENIFQNEMSKKDKELDELRRNLAIKKDDDQVKLLQETLQKLRKEISEKNKKIEELEKINKEPNNNAMNAFFMKGSNLKDIL
jgi:predicted RNase H-like nuclease (RuvC/YqgF family)